MQADDLHRIDIFRNMNNIKIIAHRSGPDILPEQTVAAALEAIKNGAEMVEIDTRFTADGFAVISHDSSTGRVFKENLVIKTIDKDKFVSLSRKEEDFHGHTLTDYLEAGVKPLLIHVKEGKENIIKLADEIRKAGYQADTTFGVHSIEDLEIARQYAPEIRLLAFMPSLGCLDEYLATDVDYIRLWEAWITKENIDKIHSFGKKVWIMTGECENRACGDVTEQSLEKVLSYDIDGILLNNVRNMTHK